MENKEITEALFELIGLTATELPEDVTAALDKCNGREEPGSNARFILSAFLKNIEMAKERKAPLCQDTGSPSFYISHPLYVSRLLLRRCCEEALIRATKAEYLRPNAVDPVTRSNNAHNIGAGFP